MNPSNEADDYDKIGCGSAFFLSILVFATGFALGGSIVSIDLHVEALQAHVAHYDAQTGEFKWGAPK